MPADAERDPVEWAHTPRWLRSASPAPCSTSPRPAVADRERLERLATTGRSVTDSWLGDATRIASTVASGFGFEPQPQATSVAATRRTRCAARRAAAEQAYRCSRRRPDRRQRRARPTTGAGEQRRSRLRPRRRPRRERPPRRGRISARSQARAASPSAGRGGKSGGLARRGPVLPGEPLYFPRRTPMVRPAMRLVSLCLVEDPNSTLTFHPRLTVVFGLTPEAAVVLGRGAVEDGERSERRSLRTSRHGWHVGRRRSGLPACPCAARGRELDHPRAGPPRAAYECDWAQGSRCVATAVELPDQLVKAKRQHQASNRIAACATDSIQRVTGRRRSGGRIARRRSLPRSHASADLGRSGSIAAMRGAFDAARSLELESAPTSASYEQTPSTR